MNTIDNSLNKVKDFSAEKPSDYNLLLLKNKIFNRVDQTLDIKKFDEKTYFDDILSVASEYEIRLQNVSTHKEEKNLHQELVRKLGHINDMVELPNEYKFLVSETRNVVSKVREGEGNFNIGLNSYLVPGSLSSLRKLLEYGVLKEKDVSVVYGNGVNMQEGVRFVKHSKNGHEGAITHFDTKDTIEKLEMNLGDNSSIAHSVAFQAKKIGENHFEYKLKTGENVFLGIDAQIGSGVEIGDNVSIWWGSILKDDVKIGNNVVVGEGVKITSGIKIPDNCLVPNGAIIRDNFEVIPYEEYKRNELKYDTKKIEKRKRRNFVVQLSADSKEDRIKQMDAINTDYTFMSTFNEESVVPENKLFAVINTLLAIVNKHFPEVGVIKEEEFRSTLNIDKLKSYNLGLEDSFLHTELSRNVKLSLKAFPKNKEDFVLKLLPKLIYAINNNLDITEEIKKELDFPELPANKEEVFLGTNILTGKAKVDENTFIYDTYIRSDELGEKDVVEITDSRIIKGVLHGGGSKLVNKSKVICTVVHGTMNVENSNVGNYKHHSVYHASSLVEVEQDSGGVVANGVAIEKTEVGFGVLFMPGASIMDSKIGDYSIIGNREINDCKVGDNTYIGNGTRAFEGVYLEGKIYNLNKEKDLIHIDKSGLENIG